MPGGNLVCQGVVDMWVLLCEGVLSDCEILCQATEGLGDMCQAVVGVWKFLYCGIERVSCVKV